MLVVPLNKDQQIFCAAYEKKRRANPEFPISDICRLVDIDVSDYYKWMRQKIFRDHINAIDIKLASLTSDSGLSTDDYFNIPRASSNRASVASGGDMGAEKTVGSSAPALNTQPVSNGVAATIQISSPKSLTPEQGKVRGALYKELRELSEITPENITNRFGLNRPQLNAFEMGRSYAIPSATAEPLFVLLKQKVAQKIATTCTPLTHSQWNKLMQLAAESGGLSLKEIPGFKARAEIVAFNALHAPTAPEIKSEIKKEDILCNEIRQATIKLREVEGLSQSQLAHSIGVIPRTICLFERGSRMSPERLNKLPAQFGCSSFEDMIRKAATIPAITPALQAHMVRTLRDSDEMSQSKWGKAVGFDKVTISQLETGKRKGLNYLTQIQRSMGYPTLAEMLNHVRMMDAANSSPETRRDWADSILKNDDTAPGRH